MVTVNREKCIGCGLCVQDCPGDKLALEEGKASYTGPCILCGHCVAVCPNAAVSIPEYDMADVEEYDRAGFALDPDQFLRAVKFRRSIRNYRETPIEREKMERILQAGRYTPTAKNRQACRFVVVEKRLEEWKDLLWEEIPRLAEEMKETLPHYAMMFRFLYRRRKKDPADDALFFNAPVFLCIASKDPLDGGLAAANIENMAVAEGAGVLYSGYLKRLISASEGLRQWLGLEDLPLTCCMLLGYPAVNYRRTAPRKPADILWK